LTRTENIPNSTRPGRLRWVAGVVFVLAVLLGATAAEAERVLIVLSSAAAPYKEAEAEAAAKLKAAGHEVQSVQLSEVKPDPAGVAKLGKLFMGIGTEAATWLNQSLPAGVPVAYCMVTDPQQNGLVGERPAAGVRADVPLSDQVKVIQESLPQTKKFGVLYRSDQAGSKANMEAMRAALPAGSTLEAVAVNEHSGAAAAISALLSRGVDIVWTTADASVYDRASVTALLKAALQAKTPVFGYSASVVRSGALLGLAVEAKDQGARAGELAVGLLAGSAGAGKHTPTAPATSLVLNLVVSEKIEVKLGKAVIDKAGTVIRPQ
jgi:putative ABC transport system substrate-binding protein